MSEATTHKVIFGDARSMSEVSDRSVHLIVTSPPYWQLKDYGVCEQIGFDDSYESYINNLNLVWAECHRILHDGCRLCINIGDQFARSVYYGRYKVIPIRTEITRFCETVGFDFMGSIIWQKVTTCNTTGGASIMGSFPYPRNGIIKIDYEFILLFKKHGVAPKPSAEAKLASELSNDDWNKYFQGHWNFPGEKQSSHIAPFPIELPHRLIRMFTFKGETVLDPFLGSGTTTLAALKLGRNSVGYEINGSFQSLIEERLSSRADLFQSSKLEFCYQERRPRPDFAKLPYQFRDPLKFDKKVDPRKLGFGSRVSAETPPSGKDFRVRQVLSPARIRLDNDLEVVLKGILPREDKVEDILGFLKSKLLGKRVELRFDGNDYDEYDNLRAYVYLQDKTFINAHLVKLGLALVDADQPNLHRTLLNLRG